MSYEGLGLPASVLARVKNTPIEDIMLAVLRQGLPDVPVYSLIPKATPAFFLLVRKLPEIGEYDGRRPFLDVADFAVHTYAQDPDGDEKGSLLSDAAVDVVIQSYLEHWRFPDLGVISFAQCTQAPSRATDWATSTGPVQYADLPTGDWRYETRFRVRIRNFPSNN